MLWKEHLLFLQFLSYTIEKEKEKDLDLYNR